MRVLLISLLALSAAPVLAQEAPVATAPPSTPAPVLVPAPPAQAAPAGPTAVPVVAAPPAPDTAVSADQAVDPLADLIAQSGPQTTDEEDAAPQAPAPPHRPTVLPIPGPDPDELPGHAIPQGGYVPMAEAYDLRVKSSIVAAQGLQGPLDGGWAIDGPGGTALYTLQVVDKVGGGDALEGAWRDMRRTGQVGSTGLIDVIDRSSSGFLARFSPRPGQQAALELTSRGDGSWTGKLSENGTETPITAHRVAQATLPAGYVPTGRGPVIWGARPAAPRVVAEAPAKGPACSTRGKKGKALKAAKAKCAAAARKAGKGKATATKGKKGGKGKAAASRKGAKGKATAKNSAKKKRRR
ncbi:hypothetical protein [Caulobacter sp. UNC279MFTsu5.1]|uniref:hypothetical protein n=1 Tax=Caulobacter sp. UNC279MFTsu5.1 TaxID=1502775 RepID=UPI0008E35494|nr:hypothetical protein [Caulobacter sp. UNC279MFTsu5.1]SFK50218.1 hypothetical protein SAMN02799626_04469 [Caulobacter sp. UNC279MFTsu5.1]